MSVVLISSQEKERKCVKKKEEEIFWKEGSLKKTRLYITNLQFKLNYMFWYEIATLYEKGNQILCPIY